jgi:hypothetical protein
VIQICFQALAEMSENEFDSVLRQIIGQLFVRHHRDTGQSHADTLCRLAQRSLKIIHRMWMDRKLYDPMLHNQNQLKRSVLIRRRFFCLVFWSLDLSGDDLTRLGVHLNLSEWQRLWLPIHTFRHTRKHLEYCGKSISEICLLERCG